MGEMNYEPVVQHFSHEHPLELCSAQQTLNIATCFGCKLKISAWFYACKACNYCLHITCSQMPQIIHHPADSNHSLYLLPTPAYPEGFFNCDACGRRGDGFSYHCQSCELDVHTLCASMPLSITQQKHQHPLQLAFFPPYQTKGFSCDICGKLGSNHWLYRCNTCEFDAHLNCATIKPKPQLQQGLQQPQTAPGAAPSQVQVLGTLQSNAAPNYYMSNPSVRVPQAVGTSGSSSGSLVNQATQAFVDSAAQNMVQSVIGGGGADGGHGCGDSSSSNSSGVLDVGSSVFSAVFGSSDDY